ncbi:hypothetical protein [Candidatus Harpocratesius sp.]
MVSTVILQVYVIYGLILMLFIYLSIKALARKRNRISITLALVFIIPAIGILINILYRAIDIYEFNIIGNKLTITLSCLGLLNIYFFDQIIRKSQVGFPLRRQILYTFIYIFLLSVLFFIPDGVVFEYKNGLQGIEGYNQKSVDPLDLGVPVWSTAFFLYGIVISQSLVVLIITTGIKQYKEIGRASIYGKKYIMTLSGMILMDLVIVGSFVFNWLNSEIGRKINLIINIGIVPAVILLYMGLKEEKEH